MSGQAGRAGAAGGQWADNYLITHHDILNTLTHFGHNAGHFMPYDSMKTDAGVHLAVVSMQIGTAYAAISNVDQNFSGYRSGWLNRFYFESFVASVVCSFHSIGSYMSGVFVVLGENVHTDPCYFMGSKLGPIELNANTWRIRCDGTVTLHHQWAFCVFIVIGKLEKLILSGEISPGEKLPSERTLMKHFDVGRNVIREAIAALSRNGLLLTRPRYRPVVAYAGQQTAIDTLEGFVRHFIDQERGYEHLFKSRAFFEAALCRHAALHARKDDIGRLREALADNKTAISDSEAFYKTDVLYHRIFYEIPKNPVFPTLHTAYVSWLWQHWKKMEREQELNRLVYSGHEAIFNAIVDRDPDEAEQALHNHLKIAWEHVKSTFIAAELE